MRLRGHDCERRMLTTTVVLHCAGSTRLVLSEPIRTRSWTELVSWAAVPLCAFGDVLIYDDRVPFTVPVPTVSQVHTLLAC